MRFAIYRVLNVVFLTSVVAIFVGCSPQRPVVKTSPQSKSPTFENSGPSSGGNRGSSGGNLGSEGIGTSDTGGGTGIDGKVFEGYHVNPLELEATQKIILPLLQDIKSNFNDNESEENAYSFFPFWSGKIWYIAPVSLQDVSRDSLGLDFIGSSTDQLARQSLGEIWIDKSKFDAMTLEEQGSLILHEMVMDGYMSKFLTWPEYCKQISYQTSIWYGSENTENEAQQEILRCDGELSPAFKILFARYEEPRALDRVDNEKIRRMTAYLLNLGQRQTPVTIKEVRYFLEDHGFDKRRIMVSKSEDSDSNTGSVEIPNHLVERALKKVVYGVQSFDQCHSLYDEKWDSCDFQISTEKTQNNTILSNNYHFSLKSPLFDMQDGFYVDLKSEGVTYLSRTSESKVSLLFTSLNFSATEGFRFYSILATGTYGPFSSSENELNFENFIIVPGVVFGVDETKGRRTCMAGSIQNGRSHQDAPVIVSSKERPFIDLQTYLFSATNLGAAYSCGYNWE